MTGRLKSICKFKGKQVADTLIPKRASAITNTKGLQIQRLQKIIYLFLLRYPTEHCSLIHWICDNVLKKILDMNFCEYKEAIGNIKRPEFYVRA